MYRTDLFEKAGLTMPEQPDLGLRRRRRQEAHRQGGRRLRHLPARQGRLGREHGVPDRHGQFLRRALVRREVAAAVRQARMEEDAHHLCRPDEGRPALRAPRSNGFNENLALFNAGKCACGSTPRSPPPSSPTPRTRRSPTRSASPWRPTTGLGKNANWLWAWILAIPAGSQEGRRRPRSSSPGRPARTTPSSSPRKEGWANVPPGTRTSLYENPEYQKAAPFAKLTLASINAADPEQADRQAGALCRRAVRRPSPSSRASAPTSASNSPPRSPAPTTVDAALAAAQILDRTRNEARRLHQVAASRNGPALRARPDRRPGRPPTMAA